MRRRFVSAVAAGAVALGSLVSAVPVTAAVESPRTGGDLVRTFGHQGTWWWPSVYGDRTRVVIEDVLTTSTGRTYVLARQGRTTADENLDWLVLRAMGPTGAPIAAFNHGRPLVIDRAVGPGLNSTALYRDSGATSDVLLVRSVGDIGNRAWDITRIRSWGRIDELASEIGGADSDHGTQWPVQVPGTMSFRACEYDEMHNIDPGVVTGTRLVGATRRGSADEAVGPGGRRASESPVCHVDNGTLQSLAAASAEHLYRFDGSGGVLTIYSTDHQGNPTDEFGLGGRADLTSELGPLSWAGPPRIHEYGDGSIALQVRVGRPGGSEFDDAWMKVTEAGALDTSWGDGGVLTPPASATPALGDVLWSWPTYVGGLTCLTRISADDGAADARWGGDGTVSLRPDYLYDLEIDRWGGVVTLQRKNQDVGGFYLQRRYG